MSNTPKQFSLDNFNVNALQEVQNKKELQLQIVKDNPFIEITNNKTFTTAKKHRTNLVTARTTLQNEKKIVVNKIKENITAPISIIYDEFINITKPHEDKQQEEVSRWEDIKEKERQEKVRLEEERKSTHRNNIKTIVTTITEEIKNLDYSSSLIYEVKPTINGEEVSLESFEEFAPTLLAEIESLKFTLESRKATLKEQEDLRLERVRLENEKNENERINGHRQTIQNFYNGWINKIYTSTFDTFKALQKQFHDEKAPTVQEFQQEYAARRAELVKEFEQRESLLNSQEQQRIELEKQKQEQQAREEESKRQEAIKQAELNAKQKADEERIQAENNRLESERQNLQKEKDELLKNQRITALKDLGFDNDLVLNLEHCKIVFPIEDILCSEEEFQNVFNNTKYQIENPPVPKDDVQEVDYEDTPVLDIETITDDSIVLVELNRQQKIMQTLLNDFCDYCLSNHGHIDKDFVVEFLTRD